MSVRAFALERAWLQGCEDDNIRDHPPWLEILAKYIPDTSAWRPGSTAYMKASYLPDTIRVEFTGMRFTVSFEYDVHQLGIHTGSGKATLHVTGTIWIDGISLRLEDIERDTGMHMG